MRGSEHRWRWRTVVVLTIGVGVVAAGTGCSSDASDRQADVAERGAQVMPFDLDATTHTFTKSASGGSQVVSADDPDDAEQIALIREHLSLEAERFRSGDYTDPARIHGMDMPGVNELAAGYERVTVAYSERPTGAELTYATTDPELVDAVHAWFDRQVSDHGDHAEAG
jgi:hypothetical protein